MVTSRVVKNPKLLPAPILNDDYKIGSGRFGTGMFEIIDC